MSGKESKDKPKDDEVHKERKPASAADIRYVAWFVLVIAAVFVINAMESGSYRTPWPVYSFVKGKEEKMPG
jgi:hypothetical protein